MFKKLIVMLCSFSFALAFAEFVPICERSRPVKELLEARLGLPCDKITETKRQTITELDFADITPGILKGGDFSGLPNLKTIHLKKFGMTKIPKGLFYFIPALSTLDLGENLLTEIRPDDFGSELPVSRLILSYNRIKSLETRLLQLSILFLSYNEIESIDSLRPWHTKEIWLSGNKITRFKPIPAKNLSWQNIRRIYLWDNPLEEFRCPSETMDSIYLSNTNIIRLTKEMFADCKNIRTLELTSNPLPNGIDSDTFEGLTNLYTVSLARNKLKNLPTGLFDTINKLSTLNLSGNQFDRNMNRIINKIKITELNLSNNKFDFLPGWFENVTQDREYQ